MVISFFGACKVYRRFVKAFARIFAPLSDKLKKESETDWDKPILPMEEQKEVFEKLKS